MRRTFLTAGTWAAVNRRRYASTEISAPSLRRRGTTGKRFVQSAAARRCRRREGFARQSHADRMRLDMRALMCGRHAQWSMPAGPACDQ